MTDNLRTIPGGLLIAFDGIDGSGKTSQLNLMQEKLSNLGWNVTTTRNLGGTPIGEELRQVILKPLPRPPLSDVYISVAIQEALVEAVQSMRNQGQIILMDRSPLSLVAYQSFGSGVSEEIGWQYCESGMNKLRPDLVFVFDCDTDTAIFRARKTSSSPDYFESKPNDFFNRVRHGFKVAAEKYGSVIINADTSIEQVNELVSQATLKLIEKSSA